MSSLLPLPESLKKYHEKVLLPLMKQWQTEKHVTPVLLFTGASGIGKRNIVHHLSQWILCERSGLRSTSTSEEETVDFFGAASTTSQTGEALLEPCNQCTNCQRALKGTWVDFIEIAPDEDDGPSKSLKIEQFRKLKSTLGFGSHEGSYKIISIPNADGMTVQAANSVLKLLEEPPAGWLFFLTASDPSLILPTILSRSQQMRLLPIPPDTLEKILGDVEGASLASRLAQGSWGRALELLQGETQEKRQAIFAFIEDPQTHLTSLIDWAAGDPKAFALLIDQLESLCGEFSRWSLEPNTPPERYAWLNSDGFQSIISHIKKVLRARGDAAAAREFWLDRSARISQARREYLAPLNKKNLIQDVLIPWLSP